MNVVNFISKDLLENRIKDGAGLLNRACEKNSVN